ncbi:MAG: hypothetical protein HUU25_15410, partial [Candidatus Sumerlaeia bacterium]|nr:hypothetical protein [Candidatus Sumerlaeia bacterium]
HSGLGLTLAQAFADRLGARLRFALPAADLFEATLTLEAPAALHSPTSS